MLCSVKTCSHQLAQSLKPVPRFTPCLNNPMLKSGTAALRGDLGFFINAAVSAEETVEQSVQSTSGEGIKYLLKAPDHEKSSQHYILGLPKGRCRFPSSNFKMTLFHVPNCIFSLFPIFQNWIIFRGPIFPISYKDCVPCSLFHAHVPCSEFHLRHIPCSQMIS